MSLQDECVEAAFKALEAERNGTRQKQATAAYTTIMERLKEPDQDMLDIAPVPDDFAKEIWQAMLSAVGEG